MYNEHECTGFINYRYKEKLADARRLGVKKGTSTGLSFFLVYFIIFACYGAAFWYVTIIIGNFKVLYSMLGLEVFLFKNNYCKLGTS